MEDFFCRLFFVLTFADEFSENRLHLSIEQALCIRFALSLHCPDNERINKVTKEKDFYYGTKENKEDVLDAREAAAAVPLDVRAGSVPTGGIQHG